MPRIITLAIVSAVMVLACLPGAAQMKLENNAQPVSMHQYGTIVRGDIILSSKAPVGINEFSYVMLVINDQVVGMAENVQYVEFKVDTTKLKSGMQIARTAYVMANGDKRFNPEYYLYVSNDFVAIPAPQVVN